MREIRRASRPFGRIRPSDGLEHDGVALSAAAAQTGRTDSAAATTQFVEQGQREAVATHTDRVAERDGAAVDVDDLVGDAEFVDRCATDSGERLVDLEQVEVADATPALSAACMIARLGCVSSEALSGPATMPYDTNSPSGATPRLSASAFDMTMTAEAPSESCDALAAVIVPSLSKAGRMLGERLHRGVRAYALVVLDDDRVALALRDRRR